MEISIQSLKVIYIEIWVCKILFFYFYNDRKSYLCTHSSPYQPTEEAKVNQTLEHEVMANRNDKVVLIRI